MSFLVCLFWLQKRGWHFVASVTIMSFLVCLFWLQKSTHDLSLHPSLSCPFLYVFSDYKRAPMTFRCIRHSHFLSCMSFLTSKEGMTCRCIRHYHVLSCMSFLTTKEQKGGVQNTTFPSMSNLEPVAFLPRLRKCHPLFLIQFVS